MRRSSVKKLYGLWQTVETQRGDRQVLVAVNGGFGVLGDMRGYGGVLENLHIQDGELITQPTDTEACFGCN